MKEYKLKSLKAVQYIDQSLDEIKKILGENHEFYSAIYVDEINGAIVVPDWPHFKIKKGDYIILNPDNNGVKVSDKRFFEELYEEIK